MKEAEAGRKAAGVLRMKCQNQLIGTTWEKGEWEGSLLTDRAGGGGSGDRKM